MAGNTVIKFAVPVLLAIVLQQVVGGGLSSIFNSGKSTEPAEPDEGMYGFEQVTAKKLALS